MRPGEEYKNQCCAWMIVLYLDEEVLKRLSSSSSETSEEKNNGIVAFFQSYKVLQNYFGFCTTSSFVVL